MNLFPKSNANAVKSTPWTIDNDPAVVAIRESLAPLTAASETIAARLERQRIQTEAAKRAHEEAANTVAALRSAWANGGVTDEQLEVATQVEASARVAASEHADRLAALNAADSDARSKARGVSNRLHATRHEILAQRRRWHEQAFVNAVINAARNSGYQMLVEDVAPPDPTAQFDFVRNAISCVDHRFNDAFRELHMSLRK